jgi:hypothetical protein
MAGIAEFYSKNLAAEAFKAMSQKAKVGGTPGRAPMGYLNDRRRVDGREVRIVVVDRTARRTSNGPSRRMPPVSGPSVRWPKLWLRGVSKHCRVAQTCPGHPSPPTSHTCLAIAIT